MAQPIYDLLARNPTFLSAHDLRGNEPLVFAAALSLGVPAALWLVALAAKRVGARTGTAVQTALCGVLLCGVAAGLATLYTESDVAWWLVALTLTALFIVAYSVVESARSLVTWMIPATLLFPVLFLMSDGVRPYLGSSAGLGDYQPKRTPDIVMIVFDELPSLALLNHELDIDSKRFPAFADLARDATWYRNATTVAGLTEKALPALLTGMRPDVVNRPPTSVTWPDNLFTALGSSYTLNVIEPVTDLCPPSLCTNLQPGFDPTLGRDLIIVFAHLIAPPALRAQLPAIDQGWQNFAAGGVADRANRLNQYGRREHFREFVASIGPDPAPQLHFLHTNLPHAPWVYLPSGHTVFRHSAIQALGADQRWVSDNRSLEHPRMLFYWQLGFVDTLLGELIDHLKAEGLYDSTLLVVTADHGLSIRPGEPRRRATEGNARDILGVPLFIKSPGQPIGRIDDRNIESVDVPRLIAAELGTPLPWPAGNPRPPAQKRILDASRIRTFPADLMVNRVRPLHPIGWPRGASPLVGRWLDELDPGDLVELGAKQVALERETLYRRVRPEQFVPAVVNGRVQGTNASHVLIVLNGRVAAVTRLAEPEDGWRRFTAMVGESAYQRGENSIEVIGLHTSRRPAQSRQR